MTTRAADLRGLAKGMTGGLGSVEYVRRMRTRSVVIENHGGYVVTADLEDEPPEHNHFDIWDGPEDSDACPRCRWETLRAEG